MSAESGKNGGDAGTKVFPLVREMLTSISDQGIEVSTETRSMVPLLEGAERVFWRAPDPAPRPGDVLVYYQRPGGLGPDAGLAKLLARSLVVHRLIRVRRDGIYRTKGDGRPQMDVQDVDPKAVLGVVTSIEHDGIRTRLTGRRARCYDRTARWVSLLGAGSYRIAVYGDAILRRVVPFWGDRRLFRAPVWWAQTLLMRAVHALLAPLCHSKETIELKAESEPSA